MPLDQEFLNYFAKLSRSTNESDSDNKGDVSQHKYNKTKGQGSRREVGRKEEMHYPIKENK